MEWSPEDLGLRPDISRLPGEVFHLLRDGRHGEYSGGSEAAALCVVMLAGRLRRRRGVVVTTARKGGKMSTLRGQAAGAILLDEKP